MFQFRAALLASVYSMPSAGGIQYIGAASGSTTLTNSTWDISGVGAILAGDFAVLVISRASAVTALAGWTTVYRANGSDPTAGVQYGIYVATKKFSGGETSISLPDHSNTAYALQVFRNVDPDYPLDVASTIQTFANDRPQPDPPAITPVSVGAWVVAVGGSHGAYEADDFTSSDLTDFIAQQNEPASFDPLVGIGYVPDWESGAVDPAQFGGGTLANPTWCSGAAASIALRPINSASAPVIIGAPDPLHWYMASHGAYSDAGGTTLATDGERVASVDNHGTQATQTLNVAPAGNGPIYRTGGQNGKPYLDVTAGEYLADLAGVSQPTGLLSYNPYTIFIVEKNVRTGANYIVGSPSAGENKVTVKSNAGVSTWYKSTVTYTQIRSETQLRIWLAGKDNNAAGGFFRGDPVTPYTQFSANNNYSPASATAQFLRHTGDAGNYDGELYEFIYFNSWLDATQCAAVFDYLSNKYAY